MTSLINIKFGECRTINYTGEIQHFGDTLAEEAMDDPELLQQILFAANEIKMMQIISTKKGNQMIDEILKPNS